MDPQRMRMAFGFGTQLTLLGKRMLMIYGVIYVIELISEHWLNIPLVSMFQLNSMESEQFYFFQFLTHPFFHNPRAPIAFLFNCLIFYFFAAPVEVALGKMRFLSVFFLSALSGAVIGFLFSGLQGFNQPFMGMLPSLLSLIVIFGLLNPEATILLMFIFPIRAKYITYLTMAITTLTFLAKANSFGAYHLGGILFGFFFFNDPRNILSPRYLYFRYQEWQFKRKRSQFRIINGSKRRDDDRPTYH